MLTITVSRENAACCQDPEEDYRVHMSETSKLSLVHHPTYHGSLRYAIHGGVLISHAKVVESSRQRRKEFQNPHYSSKDASTVMLKTWVRKMHGLPAEMQNFLAYHRARHG
jgi:hypothetical protein